MMIRTPLFKNKESFIQFVLMMLMVLITLMLVILLYYSP